MRTYILGGSSSAALYLFNAIELIMCDIGLIEHIIPSSVDDRLVHLIAPDFSLPGHRHEFLVKSKITRKSACSSLNAATANRTTHVRLDYG